MGPGELFDEDGKEDEDTRWNFTGEGKEVQKSRRRRSRALLTSKDVAK